MSTETPEVHAQANNSCVCGMRACRPFASRTETNRAAARNRIREAQGTPGDRTSRGESFLIHRYLIHR